LFPGALVVTKMTSKPTFITTSASSKHYLSEGIGIYLNAPAIHYAEHYWPNAEVLDPDRWQQAWEDGVQRGIAAPDRTRQMHGAFITFSDGARACLGRKFAQADMVAFLVAVLKDFWVELDPGTRKEDIEREIRDTSAGRITLGPIGAPNIFLRRRGNLSRAEES
jgi:cytochrome P450